MADSVAHLLATVFGLGYAPVAPGTVGSLVGVGLFVWLGQRLVPGLIVAVVVGLVGVWAARRVETMSGEYDASCIVIDEVIGQFLTFWLAWHLRLPSVWVFSIAGLVYLGVGFLLFRLFDIVKPPPVRQLERLGEGLGAMADDVMAGVYAGLVLHLIYRWGFPGVLWPT
ncbi:MAG: phosphatidylglycerophosphatase A [Acidobacteria bacterium]|nr:phosphatidylglycerophosphatase A [Acidobacteriota bacterium]